MPPTKAPPMPAACAIKPRSRLVMPPLAPTVPAKDWTGWPTDCKNCPTLSLTGAEEPAAAIF